MAASSITKMFTLASRTSGTLKQARPKDQLYQLHSSLFSTATLTSNKTPRIVFRTSENDPRQHTKDMIGLYYSIPEEDMVFFKTGLHSWHLRLMKTFNESCLMVRNPALELNGYLKNVNLEHPINRFVLYGRRGSGKTVTMHQAVQCCHRDGWVVVHVPWAGSWVRGWNKEVAPSTHKSGRYDLPTDSAEWLSHFRNQNQGKLQGLKTTSEYVWTKREKAEIGTALDEIISFGLSRLKFSSDCVGVILKELREQAASQGLKVLVAIDSINAFFVQWDLINSLKNQERKKLHPSEISLVHNFKKMLNPTWTSGAVICTVSEEVNVEDQRENFTPLYLMGQEGFERLDPFMPIYVPQYTEKEAYSNISYFTERNWIQNDFGKTEEGKKEILYVSNKNPFNIAKICAQL